MQVETSPTRAVTLSKLAGDVHLKSDVGTLTFEVKSVHVLSGYSPGQDSYCLELRASCCALARFTLPLKGEGPDATSFIRTIDIAAGVYIIMSESRLDETYSAGKDPQCRSGMSSK